MSKPFLCIVGKVEENPLTLVTITPSGTINKIRT